MIYFKGLDHYDTMPLKSFHCFQKHASIVLKVTLIVHLISVFYLLLLSLEATVVLITSLAITHLDNFPLSLYTYFKANF